MFFGLGYGALRAEESINPLEFQCGNGGARDECYFSYTQILGVLDPQNDLIAYEDTVALRLLALTCAANQELARAA